MADDDYSRHVDLTVASSSESDGHPADEMIVSKAAKRAAAQQYAATMPDADEGAAAAEQDEQPKKKRRKKKKASPDSSAVNGAAAAQPAHAEPSAGSSLQSSAAGAAGNTAAAAAAAKPRKAGSGAAMLSPSNAQQLRQQPAAPVGAAPAAAPPPGLEPETAVRPDPPDAAVPRTPAPLGVIVVDDEEDAAPNSEMQRFLRPPRYFDADDNFEAAAMRCYRCGGSGHKAQDCTNEAKARPCALCAQFGHTKANCPSLVCFKCNRSGHMAKDCTYSYNSRVTDAGSAVCLRCGSASCRGVEDWVRAEGGCTMRYSAADVALAVCYVCGRRGHLCCASTPASTYRPSCYNCGDGGHTAPDCRREKPIAVRKERDASYSAAAAPSYYDDGYGDYGGAWGFGGGGGGYGGGGGMTCYACGGEGHMARDCPNKYSNDRGGSRSTSRSSAPYNTNGRARTQQPSWQHDRR